jgi:hypothetical protein
VGTLARDEVRALDDKACGVKARRQALAVPRPRQQVVAAVHKHDVYLGCSREGRAGG